MSEDGGPVLRFRIEPEALKAALAACDARVYALPPHVLPPLTVVLPTVYVGTFGMHYDPDEIVVVAATPEAARARVEAYARDNLCAPDLEFPWAPTRDGRGEFCTLMHNYTAAVVPYEVVE